MDAKPLISIITPLFNSEKYIGETIQSVINQTYERWEMIIVDDCSTDESRDIVKSYQQKDSRIKLIESDENFGGAARPRNTGLHYANGEYVAFLDSDDVWLHEKLAKQIAFMQANTDVDICHSLANTIDEKGVEHGFFDNQRLYRKLKFFVSDKNILFYTNYININSSLMKINHEIMFDEDKNLVAIADWKYWIDNIKSGKKFYLLKEVMLNYRVRQGSISNRGSDLIYRRSIYLMSKMFLEKRISFIHFFVAVFFSFIKMKINK